jgi:hypothetical protein
MAAIHAVVAQDRVFEYLVPRGSKVNSPSGIGWPVNKKERFPCTPVLFYGCVYIVGAPVFLHRTLDRLCIEVSGDFLHKTPLA